MLKDTHRLTIAQSREVIVKNASCRHGYWASPYTRSTRTLRQFEYKMAIDCADYVRA